MVKSEQIMSAVNYFLNFLEQSKFEQNVSLLSQNGITVLMKKFL